MQAQPTALSDFIPDSPQENFPADFVAEGLDQTRGWFYTLMVLSTALFDKPAFKNLVCNGLVLAGDGKKMSKRLKNYPVRADDSWRSACSVSASALLRLGSKS